MKTNTPKPTHRSRWLQGALAALALTSFSSANATPVPLVGWEMNGLSAYGLSPFTPTTSTTNVSSGGLTRGAGFTTTGTAAGNAWGGNGLNETSFANAVSGNDFAFFTVTPAANFKVSLSSIAPYNIRRSGSGSTTGQWQYSLDGSSFTDIGSPITWGTNTAAAGNSQSAIDLSGIPALQNVEAPAQITLRVVLWGASATNGTWYFNQFQSGDDLVVLGTVETAGDDETPPTLVTTTPVDDATDVDVNTQLVLTFNEPVVAATGNLELYENGNPTPITIPTSTASIIGSVATFTLDEPLEFSTDYYVLIDADSFEDLADVPNPFAGISDATTWNFTTVAPADTSPVIASLTPSNGATNVSIDTDLIVSFDQNVFEGTGNVEIYLAATDALVESVPVTFDMVAGDTLTVSLTDLLDYETTYYVLIDAGVVENPDEEAFAGITSNTEWVFTTGINGYFIDFEGTGETKGAYASGTVTLSGLQWNMTEVLIGTIANDWKNGARSARLRGYGTSAMTMLEDKSGGADTISFSYRRYGTDTQVSWIVEYSTDGGFDWIQVGSPFTAPASDDVQTFSEPVTVTGNVRFRIRQDGTAGTSDRRLNIDDILITDLNVLPALEIVSLSPENGAIDIPVGTSLSITFNQAVQAGSGDLVIYDDEDNEIEAITVTSGLVSGNTLTVTPLSPLNPQTSYYVLLDAGAVQGLDLNPFPGIESPTDWMFTTSELIFGDGAGEAFASNATPASPLAGTGFFQRGLSDQSVSITLNAGINAVTLSDIVIEVPTDFGEPTGVVLSGLGSTGASSDIVGQTITISDATATLDDEIVVTINGLVTPETLGSGDFGLRSFTISTSVSGGTITPIATNPSVRVLLPILALRDVDGDGIPLVLGATVAVEGVATHDSFGISNTQSNIQDETAGIALFDTEFPSPFIRGNRYVVVGTIGQFNGLTQINYNSSIVINLGPDTEPTPIMLTIPALLADPELYEGSLVTVENLFYVSGTWNSAQTVIVEDADSNTIAIRIQAGSTATTEPAYPVTVTGVLSQFDSSSPFNSGYQLMPRDPDDLAPGDTPPPVGDDFASWIAGFGVAPLDGPFDAPAGDGVPNILKHVLGLAPNVAVTGSLVEVTGSGAGTLTFVHTLIKEDDLASDAIYNYEWSMDLVNWAADGDEMDGVTVEFSATVTDGSDEVFDVVEATATVTAGTADKLFVRIMADVDTAEE